jgi:hypothetical protein
MLEIIPEGPPQAKTSDAKDEQPENVSAPPFIPDSSTVEHPLLHLKERVSDAIENFKDCLLDHAIEWTRREEWRQEDAEMTLLNLHRTGTRGIEDPEDTGAELTLLKLHKQKKDTTSG